MSFVSIITPTFNSCCFITQTYQSILEQTHANWEWLVTDDCSSDGTFKLLQALSKRDSRIKVFKNKINSGAAAARNLSISHAQGDFIAFIDADDLWHSNKLEKQIAFMGNTIDFSFTAYELIDATEISLNRTVDSTQTGSFSYTDMLRKKATLGCSTVLLRKNSFKDLSMPMLRTGQDYALWLKLLKSGQNAFLLNEILTKYRILPGSISRNKFKKAKRQWQIYREVESLSFIDSLTFFSFYAYRAVFRTA